MAAPSEFQRSQFGPKVFPFDRKKAHGRHHGPLKPFHADRETFASLIYDAQNNGLPPDCKRVDLTELSDIKENRDTELKRQRCYLWVLDDDGVKILWEGIRNPRDLLEGRVKHTNITGGDAVYLGGEMYFGDDGCLYINTFSDRYAGSPKDFSFENEWQAAAAYIQEVFVKFQLIMLS